MQTKYRKNYRQPHLDQPSWSAQPCGEVTAPVKAQREAVWLFWASYPPCTAQRLSLQQVAPAADSQPGWRTSDTWRHHCSRFPTPLLCQGRGQLNWRWSRLPRFSDLQHRVYFPHCKVQGFRKHSLWDALPCQKSTNSWQKNRGNNCFDQPGSSYPRLWDQQLVNANCTGARTCESALGLCLYTRVPCGICLSKVKPSRHSNHFWQYKGAHKRGCRLPL